MNGRATDQMGCAHPWHVLVDLRVCVRACTCLYKDVRQKDPDIELIFL